MSVHSVILAGGSGTRFWPASRGDRPKQFLPLSQGKSLIQATVDRVLPLSGPQRTWILTNPTQAETIHDYLEGFPPEQVLVEPEARDTAPCIALAAATIEARDPGACLAFMPADHLIEPAADFRALLERGRALAEAHDILVTFGIQPDRAATGFGYIEKGEALDAESPRAFRVARFREKPDVETAEAFLDAGDFLWNAGIFLWTYASLHGAMREANPDLAACTEAMLDAARRGDNDAVAAAFQQAPRQSIDFAIMERAPRVAVVEAHVSWSDLGSFEALTEIATYKDPNENAAFLHNKANSLFVESKRSLVYGETPQTVTLFGVEDVVVVTVDDAVLVCPRSRIEELKTLVQALRDGGREDLL